MKSYLRYLPLLFLIVLLAGCAPADNVQATGQAAATATGEQSSHLTQTAIYTQPAPATEPPFSGDGPWQVSFSGEDGAQLQGTLYGSGEIAIVLAPAYPGGQEGWAAFAQAATAKGYRALAFDFRGYGASAGERIAAARPADIRAGIKFLQDNGAKKIVLIGAGAGGSASILVAASDSAVQGVVVISAPRSVDGLEVTDADLAALKVPSLWLATRNDLTQNIEEMIAIAASSKKDIWIYEGSSLHGTYILEGADGADLQRRLIEFVAAVTG